ncbi:MAG: LVIVD repeat-containing protein, partial [Pseudonocardiaceae bacterium]
TTISDRIYALDVGNPAAPTITDSVVVDARTINDLMTTEDGRYGVLTREGASTRKNGIVILSIEDPAHPKPIAEFTETVTGGVHSTFVYRGHVYLTDDATGSMRVIDIRDPYKPRQVARWETPGSGAGRMLHDVDVQDGLAYLSYWNNGLVILDVGNGMKGGSPESPQLVSQYKYDLDALYREVEAVGGPGFIRGTHTAWRAGKFVFVGDEVFAASPVSTQGRGVASLGRAFGRLHVIDVSDIAKPREVAYYEPKDGGVHNVWVAGDTLYLGDYQGGLRVLDISGELQGGLLRQGREIAHVVTADSQGVVPNAANAWGAIYRNGHIYVPDINSGLWIVKVEGKSELTP